MEHRFALRTLGWNMVRLILTNRINLHGGLLAYNGKMINFLCVKSILIRNRKNPAFGHFPRSELLQTLLWTFSEFLQKTTEEATGNVLRKRCSLKFRKIHRETPVLECLFHKVAGLACKFLRIFFAKYLRIRFYWTPPGKNDNSIQRNITCLS